jgi:hypothetical protein
MVKIERGEVFTTLVNGRVFGYSDAEITILLSWQELTKIAISDILQAA